jgi:hypothetical protein
MLCLFQVLLLSFALLVMPNISLFGKDLKSSLSSLDAGVKGWYSCSRFFFKILNLLSMNKCSGYISWHSMVLFQETEFA